MKLVYGIKDKPRFPQLLAFAFQQLLAIMAATIAVPMITSGHYDNFDLSMSTAAALIGAGFGTIVYLLFTKFRSPVFLGSSFAFLGSMAAAFGGAVSMQVGYLGLLIGAVAAGLVYVIIALIVKLVGVNWINKLMPAVVIGPTVAIIGLSLAGNAVSDLQTAPAGGHKLLAVLCGLITLAVTMLCSVYGKKNLKTIPFIIGILAGYAVALGADGVAAYSVICYLFPIIFMVFNATVQSAQPIISYNYGCGQMKRSDNALRLSMLFTLAFAFSIMLLFICFTRSIVTLFIPDTASAAWGYAVTGLPLFATDYLFFGINIIIIGYYTSIERLRRAISLTVLRGILPVVFFFTLPLLLDVNGIWLAVAAGDITTTVVIVILLIVDKVRKNG